MAQSNGTQRQQFQQQIEAEKEKATEKFETQLAERKQELIASGKSQVEIQEWESEQRSKFEESLVAEKQRQREQFEAEQRREKTALIIQRTPPMEVARWERETAVQFESRMEGWEQETRQTFETELAFTLTEIQTQQIGYESGVTEWEIEKRSEFEESLKRWEKEQWQHYYFKPKLGSVYIPSEVLPKVEPIKVETPSLAEQILEFDPLQFGYGLAYRIMGREPKYEESPLKTLSEAGFGRIPISAQPFKPETWFKPSEVLAGMVGYPESLVYTVAGIAGLETPRIPPGLEMAEEKPGYAFGYMWSMVGTSLVIGKVTGKIMEKTITPKAQEWLTKRYIEEYPYWKGWKETAIMKLTGAKPYVAPEIVSVPSHPAIQLLTPKELGMTTVKTSLLGTPKPATEHIVKELPKYWAMPEALIPLATKQVGAAYKPMPERYMEGFERKLVPKPISGTLPAPQVTELTKPVTFPKMPYIPTIERISTKTAPSIAKMLGLTISVTPKLLPYEKPKIEAKPTLKPMVTPISAIMPSQKAISKAEVKAVAIPKMAVATLQVQKQVQQQTQVQAQKQLQKQFQIPKTSDFELPKLKRVKGKREKPKDAFGKFMREYPIATTEKTWKTLLGRKRKK